MNNIRIGINGFGRIGRTLFRLLQNINNIEVVLINDIVDANRIAYAIKYDSNHGLFKNNIKIISDNILNINSKNIFCYQYSNPLEIPWYKHDIDFVIESTGLFLTQKDAYKHIISGADNVIITSPPKDNTPMFIMGVNNTLYNKNNDKVISNSSCTSHCVIPLLKLVNDNFNIKQVMITTINSATASQNVIDGYSYKSFCDGRSVLQNIIPSFTNVVQTTSKIIPELADKVHGISFRIPTPQVSIADINILLDDNISYKDIYDIIYKESNTNLKNILGYINDDITSIDIKGNTLVSIFDVKNSIVKNKICKLISWYDNETGYSYSLINLIKYIKEIN
ncbi:MAG: type I glyceraldehyde-3-phosphate dehydrogenase [Candidatus Lightella neohaematopini]|nr:type I glyceraldehyde-3-phosphate dehydrogenase [Candidatus Lightella neohaematopini]